MQEKKRSDNENFSSSTNDLWVGEVTFLRVFRFTLDSDKNKDITPFVSKIGVNLKKKLLTVSLYEAIPIADPSVNITAKYIESLLSGLTDNFTLKNYDGCGHTMTERKFIDAKLVDHDCPYEYSKSDILTHTLVFSFEYSKHTQLAHLPSKCIPMGMPYVKN